MVVCKFFLQGNCRYGKNCRFEHQVNDAGFPPQNYSSILRHQNFTANTNTGNTGGGTKTVDLNMLIQSVTTDMVSAEKGGQWLLSSYAPFKEKANFPGFEDRSFEEVRFGYYTARNIGTLDQYLQQLQMAQQQAASIIRSLQTPSQEAIATISNIYNSLPASSNAFGAKSPNNIFGGGQSNQQNQGLFVQQNQQQANQTSPMKSTNSIFSQTNHQNPGLFSQSPQPTNQTSSIFRGNGGGAPQNLFSGAGQQNSIFSGVNAGNAVQPPFGVVQQSNAFAQPLPAQNQPTMNYQPTNSFLGSYQAPNNQANVPPFSHFQPQQAAPFPAQNNPQSIFSTQPPTQPATGINFGLQPAPPIVPNVAPQNNVQMQPNTQISSQNLFINNSKPTRSIFGSQNNSAPQIEEDIRTYSKLEDLSENDIKSFQSAEFEFGKIPEKPPTREMCF